MTMPSRGKAAGKLDWLCPFWSSAESKSENWMQPSSVGQKNGRSKDYGRFACRVSSERKGHGRTDWPLLLSGEGRLSGIESGQIYFSLPPPPFYESFFSSCCWTACRTGYSAPFIDWIGANWISKCPYVRHILEITDIGAAPHTIAHNPNELFNWVHPPPATTTH